MMVAGAHFHHVNVSWQHFEKYVVLVREADDPRNRGHLDPFRPRWTEGLASDLQAPNGHASTPGSARPKGKCARNYNEAGEFQMSLEDFADCISACRDCAAACEKCAAACLKEDDGAAMAECIALDRDCADLCRLAATLMARNSRFSRYISELCADACEACAAECEKHESEHCQDCAKACRRCAEECIRIASPRRAASGIQAIDS